MDLTLQSAINDFLSLSSLESLQIMLFIQFLNQHQALQKLVETEQGHLVQSYLTKVTSLLNAKEDHSRLIGTQLLQVALNQVPSESSRLSPTWLNAILSNLKVSVFQDEIGRWDQFGAHSIEQMETSSTKYVADHIEVLLLVLKNIHSGMEASKIINQPVLTNLVKTFQMLFQSESIDHVSNFNLWLQLVMLSSLTY
jgi:hypothetical protein